MLRLSCKIHYNIKANYSLIYFVLLDVDKSIIDSFINSIIGSSINSIIDLCCKVKCLFTTK